MSFVKIEFQKDGAERSNNNVRYVENNVFVFFTLNHVNIALHQIHQIILFLASSYDPFKTCFQKIYVIWNILNTNE